VTIRPQFIVASANPDKVAEIAAIFGPMCELLPRPEAVPDVVEDAVTLEGNARLKARAICTATARAAVADDTGLEVDALGGLPGVRTGRYAGESATYSDNVSKLMMELTRVNALEPDQRRARFRTVAMVCFPDGSEIACHGVVDGTIALTPRGVLGFGYDPVFIPDGRDGKPGGETFAEMSADDKHAISHRGIAFRALAVAINR